jgi:hypothetical protein
MQTVEAVEVVGFQVIQWMAEEEAEEEEEEEEEEEA